MTRSGLISAVVLVLLAMMPSGLASEAERDGDTITVQTVSGSDFSARSHVRVYLQRADGYELVGVTCPIRERAKGHGADQPDNDEAGLLGA